ncbi:Protein CBG27779 [Caenorhabditis briggsae]|uniref:Protein CBG27779 n=1 Tax=Caenorhabditis briggsae TaxID=6238 RepID=B6II16_CAEBR|nr:Protein CBG27779 [Caenorhabditis briggsae]CAR99546.1 Protein CBG27779 [Caenorhabditis briggsae]
MTGKAKLVKKYEGYSRIALSKDKYEVEEDMEELRKMRAQNHMVDYSDVQYNHLEIKPRGAINIYGDLISPFDKLEYSQIPEHFFLLDHSGHSSINRNPTVPERWLSSQNVSLVMDM